MGEVLRLPTRGRGTAPAPLGWAELHVHSSFSFLQGACSPEVLAAEAARLGVEVLAVTDRDGLYAARRLAAAARRHGLRAVHGAELGLPAPYGPVLVLARDLTGFSRLSALISAAQLAGAKQRPVYDPARFAEAVRDGHLAVLTGCPETGPRRLPALVELLGPEHLHVELIDHALPADSVRNDAVYAAAHRLGLPVVASNAVTYARPRDARLAQALTALRRRETLDHAAGHLPAAPTAHLRAPDDMARRLARYPGVHEATVELGRACAIDLCDLRPELPGFPVPFGHTEMSYLRELATRAAERRYGPRGEAAHTAWIQLEKELGVIDRLDMAGYFLIVWDIVRWSVDHGIWCQGRGSAANSVVCHVLGITAVDPIRHQLLFERFLSLERAETPDIDIDIENARREEVIQYVYERWGRSHAAQVANIITYRPRLAVRDSARALGYPTGRIDEMTRHIHHHEPPGEDDDDIPVDVRELAGELAGLPRHLGVHSGGMVLTRRPIGEVMPVEWATAEDRSVLQGDKEDAEEAGLVKIDLLGLGMLSALHTTCDLIAEHHGATYDLASIPPDDPAVFEMISRADTVGLFQVESRAQMSTLPRLRPRTFQDLVVAVSLIRPGPIQGGSVHPYLRRRAGKEPVSYPHPLAERALRRTLGVPLYQEQMMLLAMDCAGFGPGEADTLRKALAAKHAPERVAELRRRLLAGMAERGIGERAAEELYTMIQAFSGYGFPESHSQSLAHIVYASAWLKVHYPAAFIAGVLANQPMGFYSPLTLIGDARRRGVRVHGVDVARSGLHAGLEADEGSRGGQAIRLGLSGTRGMPDAAAEAVIAGRPYRDLEDFARRTRLPVKVLENLATAGALVTFGVDRREALWAAGALAGADEGYLPGTTAPPEAPELPAMTVVEQTFADLWATGASPDSHPVQHLRAQLKSCGVVTAAEVRTLPDGTRTTVGGLVTHRQRPPTAKGTCFLNVEDETGMTNVIVPPPVWDAHMKLAVDHAGLLIRGRVERADGAVNLVAHSLRPLGLRTPARGRVPGPGRAS
ncbi:DNA polymerase III subunit alpha [Streptomyces sp. SID5785]|uniref:error-prone DNA polymerase n=1 Tax=Streptomyces sp. SID5785 TaxID=2690309 RepID=UPI001361967C|nr:error-prone DNA polymerase [Streptomyces sp. SID5785]MZD09879.1 DNA polymerase III subunit alpha [Streptomyces sp. SID5785]MZD10003.1 DNA polymerase III subunit alpha [Streptomyces sp. SID5785]